MRFVARGALSILAGALTTGGCATANSTSPWQYGIEARISPGVSVADSGRISVHATVAYARYFLGGSDGERDEIFNFGGQIRFVPGQDRNGFWLGIEPAYGERR